MLHRNFALVQMAELDVHGKGCEVFYVSSLVQLVLSLNIFKLSM